MKRGMAKVCRISVFTLMSLCSVVEAQEVRHIELISTQQRINLRHPASQGECKGCLGGGSGGGSVQDGGPNPSDPHALGVFLLRVAPTDIDPTQPFQVEFKVLNTGTAPIELPVSLHLSDLQPSDDSISFSYFSLALAVRGQGKSQRPDTFCMGFVELYGSPEHPESVIALRPGEWIRVTADVRLKTWPAEPVETRFKGDFWLRRNTFHPEQGGEFREAVNLYPNSTRTPYVPVRLITVPLKPKAID
jgi:hypothetical protein